MKKKKLSLVLSLTFIIIFAVFTLIISSGFLTSVDFQLTVYLQKIIPYWLDTFLSAFSILGSFEILTSVLVFSLLLRRKLNGLIVFCLYSIGMFIEVLGKILIFHPGPPRQFFRYDLSFLFPSSFVHTKFSYPSGHAMRSSFLIVFLIFLVLNSKKNKLKKKLLIFCLLVLLVIMLISRVSLGEHWTSDVLAGMLLGAGLGFLSTFFQKPGL